MKVLKPPRRTRKATEGTFLLSGKSRISKKKPSLILKRRHLFQKRPVNKGFTKEDIQQSGTSSDTASSISDLIKRTCIEKRIPLLRSPLTSNNSEDCSQTGSPSDADESSDACHALNSNFLIKDESSECEDDHYDMPSFIANGYGTLTPLHPYVENKCYSEEEPMNNFEVSKSRKGKLKSPMQVKKSVPDSEYEPNQRIIPYSSYETGSIVLVVDHPASFAIYGKAEVRALSGSVDILGYNVDSKMEKSLYLYSFQEVCSLQIKTKSVDWKSVPHWKNVKNTLKEFVPKEMIASILSSCCDSSVILLLRKHDLAYAVDFAFKYIPCSFPYEGQHLKMYTNKGFIIDSNSDCAIGLSKLHETISEFIEAVVHMCAINGRNAPRIFAYGKRGLGKSTTLRYFVNKILSILPKVYYLDTDPGQTEFTPPGCVSLVEVTKPLLGPPFTHPKIPVKMAFYGSIQIDDTSTYLSCVDKVVEFYKKNYSDYPLFINTCGWIGGLGKECLDHIRDALKPDIVVELVSGERDSISYDKNALLESASAVVESNETTTFELPNDYQRRLPQFTPRSRRELSILSYFGRCQRYYEPIKTLNSFRPICVRIDEIALHVINFVFPKCILQAINASLVALCIVDESQILVCVDEEKQPKRLAPDADFSECVGFGFVRAIDMSKNLLYLLTPEPLEVMKKVNTLVKGNVLMPDVVFLKQEIYDKPLPYVRQNYGKKPLLSQKIKRQ